MGDIKFNLFYDACLLSPPKPLQYVEIPRKKHTAAKILCRFSCYILFHNVRENGSF